MAQMVNRLYPEDPQEIQPRQTLDSGTPPVRIITARDPLRWLALGWHDLWRAPSALLHGLAVAAGGMAIIWFTSFQPWLPLVFVAGFLLLGPALAVGVNELARRLERGERVGWRTTLSVAGEPRSELWAFAAILLTLFILWIGFALLWVATLNIGSPALLDGFGSMLRTMLSSPQGIVSLLGVIAGGAVFAVGAFALSLVTLPAVMDLRCPLVDAIATSLKAVLSNPGPTLLWGALITALFAASVLTAFVALVVVFPWLGFAMWHGYRDLVVRDVGDGTA
jgi:uncharacterized membrane protein